MIVGCEFKAEQGIGCKGQGDEERPCVNILIILEKFQGSEALRELDMTDAKLFGCPILRVAQRIKDLERTSMRF